MVLAYKRKVFVFFVLFAVVLSLASVSASSVTRSFSTSNPEVCSTLNVTLDVVVNGNDTFYIIDEIYPSGWSVVNAGGGNTSDSGHIKWVVMSAASSTTYSYSLSTPCTQPGEYNFSGEYGFDDLILYNISGENSVNVIDTELPVITLLGNSIVNLEYANPYFDAGATALDNVDGDLTANITVTGTVNTIVLGTYLIRYNVQDSSGNNATEVVRTVNVIDTGAPVITLLGNTPVTVEYGSSYTDAGATAYDDSDGNLTSSIITNNLVNIGVLGQYTVTYNVQDSSGNNATEVVRTVDVVDTTIPVITLLGDSIVNILFGSTYTDAGATALDNHDGDLTASIVTLSNVNSEAVGNYTVTYNVQDSSGNNATEVVRTVNVEPLVCQTTADTDGSYRIDMSELLVHIGKWYDGDVENIEIMRSINFWKIGLGC